MVTHVHSDWVDFNYQGVYSKEQNLLKYFHLNTLTWHLLQRMMLRISHLHVLHSRSSALETQKSPLCDWKSIFVLCCSYTTPDSKRHERNSYSELSDPPHTHTYVALPIWNASVWHPAAVGDYHHSPLLMDSTSFLFLSLILFSLILCSL